MDPRRAAEMARGVPVEEFARKLGVSEKTFIARQAAGSEKAEYRRLAEYLGQPGAEYSPGWFSKQLREHAGAGFTPPGPHQAGNITLSEKEILRSAYQTLGTPVDPNLRHFSRGVIERELPRLRLARQKMKSFLGVPGTREDLMKAHLYHEYLESAMARKLGAQGPQWGSHLGEQVVFGEAGFVQALGNKQLTAYYKKMRTTQDLLVKNAGARTQSEVFEAGLEGFSGMRHGGMAEWKRKLMTDFGSKYDPLRNIAKSLGETFEQFVSGRSFQAALKHGEVVKKVGEGGFGKAYLMRSAVPGPEGPELIQFVKKVSLPELSAERVLLTDMGREARMLRSLQHTETVPSLYKYEETSAIAGNIFMEYMPGKTLLRTRGVVPKDALRALERTAEEAARLRIVNTDIAARNLIYDPVTKRTSWIDWGFGEKFSVHQTRHSARQRMLSDLRSIESSLEKTARPSDLLEGAYSVTEAMPQVITSQIKTAAAKKKGLRRSLVDQAFGMEAKRLQRRAVSPVARPVARSSLASTAEDLRIAQKELWSASTQAGKRHVRRTPGDVTAIGKGRR
jgi:hypothetical protein